MYSFPLGHLWGWTLFLFSELWVSVIFLSCFHNYMTECASEGLEAKVVSLLGIPSEKSEPIIMVIKPSINIKPHIDIYWGVKTRTGYRAGFQMSPLWRKELKQRHYAWLLSLLFSTWVRCVLNWKATETLKPHRNVSVTLSLQTAKISCFIQSERQSNHNL